MALERELLALLGRVGNVSLLILLLSLMLTESVLTDCVTVSEWFPTPTVDIPSLSSRAL